LKRDKFMISRHSGVDFVAYNRDDDIVLLADAKSRCGTSEDWAAGLRRNMLSHGFLPSSKFFLIATPDRIYVWKNGRPGQTAVRPEFTTDAAKVLHPYFQRLNQDPSKIGPEAFEILVLTWLNDVAGSDQSGTVEDPSLAWLSDLAGSLREARIEMNAVQ
jgi:hypothetical protein